MNIMMEVSSPSIIIEKVFVPIVRIEMNTSLKKYPPYPTSFSTPPLNLYVYILVDNVKYV